MRRRVLAAAAVAVALPVPSARADEDCSGKCAGERCRNMNIGRHRRGAPTKHPHRERWTLVQADR